MKKYLLHFLFVLIVAGDLLGEFTRIPFVDYIFKPLIMVWIGGYFMFFKSGIDKQVVKMATLGFLFSWFGDLFMMFSGRFLFFVLGIASFLVAQLFYSFLFLRTINISGKRPFLKKRPVWLTVYIAYGLIVYIVLFPHLGMVLKAAILFYLVAILTMSAMALNRYGNGHPHSFSLVFAGSLLFVCSDTMIAVNRFIFPLPYEGLLIMSSYIAAQYLIMRGILKQYE
ncbi:lysoplasmalogenase [uncultured Draconibacterium sp.]|uniref:lysoplasmalogenase n=1 Tax=uncultured Draconibacterium sp. TaxID=1573823 RepID=UPI003217536C